MRNESPSLLLHNIEQKSKSKVEEKGLDCYIMDQNSSSMNFNLREAASKEVQS